MSDKFQDIDTTATEILCNYVIITTF